MKIFRASLLILLAAMAFSSCKNDVKYSQFRYIDYVVLDTIVLNNPTLFKHANVTYLTEYSEIATSNSLNKSAKWLSENISCMIILDNPYRFFNECTYIGLGESACPINRYELHKLTQCKNLYTFNQLPAYYLVGMINVEYFNKKSMPIPYVTEFGTKTKASNSGNLEGKGYKAPKIKAKNSKSSYVRFAIPFPILPSNDDQDSTEAKRQEKILMPNTYLYDRTTFNHRNITSKIR
jgi:hypothetical protein